MGKKVTPKVLETAKLLSETGVSQRKIGDVLGYGKSTIGFMVKSGFNFDKYITIRDETVHFNKAPKPQVKPEQPKITTELVLLEIKSILQRIENNTRKKGLLDRVIN